MDWKVGSPATVTGWKVRRGSFFLSAESRGEAFVRSPDFDMGISDLIDFQPNGE
jgi:hypothetical protein